MTQVSRTDYGKLYDAIRSEVKLGRQGLSLLTYHVIAAEVDGFMSQRLLPQYAESCATPIKENKWGGSTFTQLTQFSYTDEDGQAHTTRRIDWTYIFS